MLVVDSVYVLAVVPESHFIAVVLLYDRYLHFYEKINHFGQALDVRDDTVEGDETSVRRKTISAVSTVSFSYNYHQHNLTGLYLHILLSDDCEFIAANLAYFSL